MGGLSHLLARATTREPMKTADSKSGATFERVVIDDQHHVLKVVDGRAICLWENGAYQQMPPSIDHGVVAAGRLEAPAPWPAALLMHDVGELLVPEDAPVPVDVHAAFLEPLEYLGIPDVTEEADGALEPEVSGLPFGVAEKPPRERAGATKT